MAARMTGVVEEDMRGSGRRDWKCGSFYASGGGYSSYTMGSTRWQRRAMVVAWLGTIWLGFVAAIGVTALWWDFGWNSNYVPSLRAWRGMVVYFPGNSEWDRTERTSGTVHEEPEVKFAVHASRRDEYSHWDATFTPDPNIGEIVRRNGRVYHFPQQLAWADGVCVLLWVMVRMLREKTGCPKCGYDLRGIAKYDERGTNCPECGRLIHPRDLPVAGHG